MAIIANQFTAQKPMSATGATGTQSFKVIPAPRVFIKSTPDSTSAAVVPNVKANGTPSNLVGWTDLGVVDGMVKISYEKKVKEVRTGIDNYLRAAYTDQKGGQLEFDLNQVDDVVLAKLSGLTSSTLIANSAYTYHLGQEDLTQVALLLVVQNKLDGKEWQFYTPLAYLNFAFNEKGDAFVVKATGILPFFTVSGQSNEEVLAASVFA